MKNPLPIKRTDKEKAGPSDVPKVWALDNDPDFTAYIEDIKPFGDGDIWVADLKLEHQRLLHYGCNNWCSGGTVNKRLAQWVIAGAETMRDLLHHKDERALGQLGQKNDESGDDEGDELEVGNSDDDVDEEQEEKTMLDKVKDAAGNTGSKFLEAGTEGFKLAGAKNVGRVITQKVRNRLGSLHPAILDTEIGMKAEPVLVAGLVHFLVGVFPDRIPQGANLQRNCERVATAEMSEVGDELIEAVLPLLTELAASVPKLGFDGGDDPEIEAPRGRSKKAK